MESNNVLFASVMVILDLEKNLGRSSRVKVPHVKNDVKIRFGCKKSVIYH